MNNDTLDREREFYFGKLRDIEEMLQKRGMDQDPLGSEILKILYASEEEQVTVNEKGELIITQAGEVGWMPHARGRIMDSVNPRKGPRGKKMLFFQRL